MRLRPLEGWHIPYLLWNFHVLSHFTDKKLDGLLGSQTAFFGAGINAGIISADGFGLYGEVGIKLVHVHQIRMEMHHDGCFVGSCVIILKTAYSVIKLRVDQDQTVFFLHQRDDRMKCFVGRAMTVADNDFETGTAQLCHNVIQQLKVEIIRYIVGRPRQLTGRFPFGTVPEIHAVVGDAIAFLHFVRSQKQHGQHDAAYSAGHFTKQPLTLQTIGAEGKMEAVPFQCSQG